MEFLRRAANPWNQEVWLGVSWDLLWAATIVGFVFLLGHAIYAFSVGKRGEEADVVDPVEGLPARILRHTLSARVFHWLMSVAMFALLITAFFPVIGIRFAWVGIHWIAGVLLTVAIVYHIIHSYFWQDFKSIWIDRADLSDGTGALRRFFGKKGVPQQKAGKYPLDHKLYHHIIAVVTLGAIGTGLFMMARIDTPLWARNPYLLSDQMWGVVYVLHGLSGVALITLVMAHIYFAIRPEKRWITWSMIHGWVDRRDFLRHHDPLRWPVSRPSPPSTPSPGGAPSLQEGAPQDKQAL